MAAKKAKAKKKAVKKTAPAAKKKIPVKKTAPVKKKAVAKKKVVAKKKQAPAPAKKKASAKKKKEVITKKSLETAINEMNDVGDWEPALNRGTEEEMRKTIEEELSEVLDDDPFTSETWAVIKELGFGSTKKKKKEESKKKGKASAKQIRPKKMNMINTIVAILEKHGPITRKDIHKKLVADFPERNPKHLEDRVRLQVPNSLNREKHLGIVGDKEKGFYIEK